MAQQVDHDLTHETYLRLHQAWDRLPALENQRVWIYRIATNLAFNELKRRRRFAWLPRHKAETNGVMAMSVRRPNAWRALGTPQWLLLQNSPPIF